VASAAVNFIPALTEDQVTHRKVSRLATVTLINSISKHRQK
jgi:hypothetical protein